MCKKVLFVATVYRFFTFERSDMQILKDMGYEIHTASNMCESDWLKDDGLLDDLGVIKHQIDFARSPFSRNSVKAYQQLQKLSQDIHFDLIHCHTPVAAAICRLAVRKARSKGSKVVYTDHGFHFHKTSGWKTWALFYPIEYLMAHYTDMILTINREDYHVISKFPVKDYRYIPGVGVDVQHIIDLKPNRQTLRAQYNIPENAFLIMSVGELSARKNHEVIIKAMSLIPRDDIYYLICGTGDKRSYLENLASEKTLNKRVVFAGQLPHETILNLYYAADIGAIPSLIEGLGLAGIEALAAGKPLVGSNVHGIKDYVLDGETGVACPPQDVDAYKEGIMKLYSDKEFYHHCCERTIPQALEFDIRKVRILMKENYRYILGEQ